MTQLGSTQDYSRPGREARYPGCRNVFEFPSWRKFPVHRARTSWCSSCETTASILPPVIQYCASSDIPKLGLLRDRDPLVPPSQPLTHAQTRFDTLHFIFRVTQTLTQRTFLYCFCDLWGGLGRIRLCITVWRNQTIPASSSWSYFRDGVAVEIAVVAFGLSDFPGYGTHSKKKFAWETYSALQADWEVLVYFSPLSIHFAFFCFHPVLQISK